MPAYLVRRIRSRRWCVPISRGCPALLHRGHRPSGARPVPVGQELLDLKEPPRHAPGQLPAALRGRFTFQRAQPARDSGETAAAPLGLAVPHSAAGHRVCALLSGL